MAPALLPAVHRRGRALGTVGGDTTTTTVKSGVLAWATFAQQLEVLDGAVEAIEVEGKTLRRARGATGRGDGPPRLPPRSLP